MKTRRFFSSRPFFRAGQSKGLKICKMSYKCQNNVLTDKRLLNILRKMFLVRN